MTIAPNQLDDALQALAAIAGTTPGLSDELAATGAAFLGRSGPRPGSDDEVLTRRRHLEWFLLERPSSALGGVPIEVLMHGGLETEQRELPPEDLIAALVSSHCGIFQVTGVRSGEGVWLRDMLAYGEYPLQEVEGSLALEEGDLVVGRVFPIGAELYRMSAAAGMWRNPELVAALGADLERVRSQRRGVQRLSQEELETMFWGDAKRNREASVQRARAVLTSAGLSRVDIEDIFTHLRTTPYDPARRLPGGGDAVGAVLDHLAFDTEVDLGHARAALLEVWPALSAPPVAAPTSEEIDVARAIAKFDQGRTEGRDLEDLFNELESELQIEDGEAEDDTSPAPDFPGVVGAMVEEFLWEIANEEGAEVATGHESLRELSRFGASIGLFEELGSRELLSFTAVWLPEWGGMQSAAEAQAMLGSLRAFCAWSEDRHEHPLATAFDDEIAPLEQSLPRIVEANRCRVRAEPTSGELYEYVAGAAGQAEIQDGAGGLHTSRVPAAITEHLRAGDRLRGVRKADGEFTVYCCYPAECASLANGR